MGVFKTTLDVRLLSDKENHGSGEWIIMSPLVFQSDVAGEITVATGFKTDFASVPRVPVVFDVVGDIAHSAATVHDFLYSTGQVSRKVADDVFLEAAISSGVNKWKAWAMWLAIRMFGSQRYKVSQS